MKPRWLATVRYLPLLLLPCVLMFTAAGLASARGPVWLGTNSDPGYQYLLNALLILHGQPPAHTDHPGTPVQVIGAAVLRLTTPGGEADARTLAVLADPEAALARIHACSLGLTAAVLAVAGILALRQRGSWLLAIALQLLPLLQAGTFRSTLGFDPEAFLLPLTVLFVTLLVIRTSPPEPTPDPRAADLRDVALGLLAGIGLVTKLTFAPLCLLPFVLHSSRRGAVLTAAAMAAGAGAALAPVLGELPRILRWVETLATHTGTYGSGAAGFIDGENYLGNLRDLFCTDLLLVLVPLALGTGLAILATGPDEPRVRRLARLLIGAGAIQTLAVLLIAKHPHARYLMPVALSCTLNVVLLLDLALVWPRRGVGRGAAALLAGLTAAAAVLVVLDLRQQTAELATARDAQLAHNRRADRAAAGGTRVDYYRSSSVAFALYFGNNSAARFFAEPLSRLHPGRVFFNPWVGLYENFGGTADVRTLFRNGPVYLIGNGGIERLPTSVRLPKPAGWQLTRMEQVDGYTIHLLQPTP